MNEDILRINKVRSQGEQNGLNIQFEREKETAFGYIFDFQNMYAAES